MVRLSGTGYPYAQPAQLAIRVHPRMVCHAVRRYASTGRPYRGRRVGNMSGAVRPLEPLRPRFADRASACRIMDLHLLMPMAAYNTRFARCPVALSGGAESPAPKPTRAFSMHSLSALYYNLPKSSRRLTRALRVKDAPSDQGDEGRIP